MINFPVSQPDIKLKLKLYQEKLLKNFTKHSFHSFSIKNAQKGDPREIDLQQKLESQKYSNADIEGTIMQRMKTISPKKKQKFSESLNKKIKNRLSFQAIKLSFHKNKNELISSNDFVEQLSQTPAKFLNDSLDYRQEYLKKIEKINSLFKDNFNNYLKNKSQNQNICSEKPQQIFKNETFHKALILTQPIENSLKKIADSIPSPHKQIVLEINQTKAKRNSSNGPRNMLNGFLSPKTNSSNGFVNFKIRAQSANETEIQQLTDNIYEKNRKPQVNYSDFRNRFYRMQDLDKLLAKSLTITEKINYKDYEKNKFLKGPLRNSSNLNYHMDAILRSIEKGKNKKPRITNEQIESYKEKLIQNFKELRLNPKKTIQDKLVNIEKMHY